MPYNNAYNQSIAMQNQSLYKKKIAYQNACDENTRTNDVMSPLEGVAMREQSVSGGSGTAAATLHDLGYEQMSGVTGSGEPPAVKKRSYNRKPKPEVVALPTADANQNISAHAGGVSGGGVSAGSADGGGVSGGSIARAVGAGVSAGAKRGRKKKEEAEAKVPAAVPPEQAMEVVGASHTAPPAAGSGKPKRTNARAAVVGRIMKEKGMKMAEASKYVKEHGLYKKGAP
jgi:hypothetical protein